MFCRYLHKPYLISGNKFDLRIYVYVTSYDPLRIYIFSDGLVRFASCKSVFITSTTMATPNIVDQLKEKLHFWEGGGSAVQLSFNVKGNIDIPKLKVCHLKEMFTQK